MFKRIRQGSTTVQCPRNWTLIEGSCFAYFREHVTFAEAEKLCATFPGGHLASLHGRKEACKLARHLVNFDDLKDVWIGLQDVKKNRDWIWTDSSKFTYKAWDAPTQPDNFGTNEYCTQLIRAKAYTRWNDINCYAKSPYLCKLTPTPPTPPRPVLPKECT
ncbi:hypothetical protein lerEdw1_014246 [Lerista edwardsae]|nr:hypothetical protein lerEdw1_014246 [Lerista edwardsae]